MHHHIPMCRLFKPESSVKLRASFENTDNFLLISPKWNHQMHLFSFWKKMCFATKYLWNQAHISFFGSETLKIFQCLYFFKNHFFRILLISQAVQFMWVFSLNYWLRQNQQLFICCSLNVIRHGHLGNGT